MARSIFKEQPFWGYRRVWARLRFHFGLVVNEKRIYRIMKENDLIIKQRNTLKAIRTPKPKPKAEKTNQYWGIDMTKIWVQDYGWVYIVPGIPNK